MAYFRELPNLEYISVFKDRKSNNEYTLTKNIFRRPKLREDLASAVTAFEYYQIIGDERPDQIAEKFYSNAELDWIILITNNITNYNEEWPLNHDALYNYMINKYGSEEEIQKIHHYETVEYRDEFGRLLIEGGLQVDPGRSETIETNINSITYKLNSFPSEITNDFISVNLNQTLKIVQRDSDELANIYIKDIVNNESTLNYLPRNSNSYGGINIFNTLNDWPSSWNGFTIINLRNGNEIVVSVDDIILDNKVRITENLYQIIGEEQDGNLIPYIQLKRSSV